jgi:hypothetical protein
MMVYDNFMSVQKKKALTSVLWVSEIFVEKYGSFFLSFLFLAVAKEL